MLHAWQISGTDEGIQLIVSNISALYGKTPFFSQKV